MTLLTKLILIHLKISSSDCDIDDNKIDQLVKIHGLSE